jgi:hypothetical protein
MSNYASAALFLLVFSLNAQNKQVLRGKIVNSSNQLPVAGVQISAIEVPGISSVSDSAGNYSVSLPYGKYSILAEHVGFKSKLAPDILLASGKQQVLDIELDEFKVRLDTVKVETNQPVGTIPIDVLNTQRVASVNYDPARLVNSHAGVINTDDQANHFSVHGTSPNYIQWKIEGVEVVNPNHLENAGTLSDKPALNGGGVSILSAQLLQSSNFYFAPFDALGGNASSGIFDIRLRKGNDQKQERIIQASLLGTDICLEGPFSKKSSASYIVNYRYSTVGLLSLMGVNFGDEKINYTDLSYMVALPYKKGSVRVFGIAGNSKNIFQAKKDSSEIEIGKDLQNIDYRSFTSVNGISVVNSLSNSVYIKAVLAYSRKDLKRSAEGGNFYPELQIEERDEYSQRKLSSVVYAGYRIGNASRIKLGSYVNYFNTQIRSEMDQNIIRRGDIYEGLIQPFVTYEGALFRDLHIECGLQGMYQNRNGYFNLQPRCLLRYDFSSRHSVSLRYGRSSQLHPAELYIYRNEVRDFAPLSSDAVALDVLLRIRTVALQGQLFYQSFSNTLKNDVNPFSGFNYFNETLTIPVESGGAARLYGIDLSAQKHRRNFYLIISTSIYNSEYSLNGRQFSASRFNTNYNAVLTIGDELRLKDEHKLLGLNLRALTRNGFMESLSERREDQFVYERRLPSYFRIDIRISYRKNKPKSSYIWALDIQNVTNQKNIAYHYYDIYAAKELTRYQLGIIPVLSYKILF